jgi:single-strand DNA-binding protein
MARGMNHIYLVGTIAREPEVKYTPAGLEICDLTVAGEDLVVGNDGATRRLPWYHRVSLLGKPARAIIDQVTAKTLAAGSAVLVEGSLDYRTWEAEGQKRTAISIKTNRVELVERVDMEVVTDSGGGLRLANGINQVFLIGNLGRDVEIRGTPSGDQVASVSVAVSEFWMDRDNKPVDKTHWIELSFWRDVAEIVRDLKKGTPILVMGRLKNESWLDQNGQKRNTTKVEVTRVEVLSRGPSNPTNLTGEARTTPQPSRQAVGTGAAKQGSQSRNLDIDEGLNQLPPEDDDLPF